MAGIIHINPSGSKVLRILIPGMPPLFCEENRMAGVPIPLQLPHPNGQLAVVGAALRCDIDEAFDDNQKRYTGIGVYGSFVYFNVEAPLWWKK